MAKEKTGFFSTLFGGVSSTFLRVIRSAVVTLLGTWWAAKQSDVRYVAIVPIVHGAFKWLRDRFPGSKFLEYLPF